jgi:hypothetical protein
MPCLLGAAVKKLEVEKAKEIFLRTWLIKP